MNPSPSLKLVGLYSSSYDANVYLFLFSDHFHLIRLFSAACNWLDKSKGGSFIIDQLGYTM